MSAAARPISLELPAVPSSAAVVRAVVAELIAASPQVRLDRAAADEVAVAVQEACTNVIRHGCGARPDRTFTLVVEAGADALRMTFRDDGPEYRLARRAAPRPEDLQEGGYGMFLMYAWMHDVRLERRGGENVLILERRYEPLPAAEPADA